MNIDTPGILYIVAAPSGGGKTSIVKRLLEEDQLLRLSVSHTTRKIRPGEVDGKHYHFVDEARFQQMVEQDEFIEHATVFNHSYGTSKMAVMKYLEQGLDVIFDIDWQGARQLASLFKNTVSIFILPPSYDALEERLRKRGQDDDSVIKTRMSKAKMEISHCHEFDYAVFNDDFDVCFAQIKSIVEAARLKYAQQFKRNTKLLSNLL